MKLATKLPFTAACVMIAASAHAATIAGTLAGPCEHPAEAGVEPCNFRKFGGSGGGI